MSDLLYRPRRLRRTENLRALVRETRLAAEDFILPLFACAGEKVRREIPSMPGVHNSVWECALDSSSSLLVEQIEPRWLLRRKQSVEEEIESTKSQKITLRKFRVSSCPFVDRRCRLTL